VVNTLNVLLSIHVLASVFWVGGGFLLNVAMLLAARSGDPASRLAAMRLAHFVEPGIKGGLKRGLILVPAARSDELSKRAPGDDPHGAR